MLRRVTPPGAFLRKRAGVTGFLACHRRPRRTFSGTCPPRLATHYDTLSIPRNASKSQIKSAYYKLSKQFHPDINKEPKAREKFLAFSEAYAVLGDDRQRRSYDRSLVVSGGEPHRHHHHHPPPNTYSHYATANEARRRSANYAWERRRRPPPSSNPNPNPHATAHHPRSHSSSGFASNDPHVHSRRAADALHYRPPRTGWKQTEMDHVNHVSGLGRAVQLVGLFIAVAIVGTLGKS